MNVWILPRCAAWVVVFLTCASVAAASTTVDFEDLGIPANSFHNGDPGAPQNQTPGSYDGSFTSRGAHFNNTFTVSQFGSFTFTSWSGWSASTVRDVTTPGFGNQYAAYDLPSGGAGAGGSDTYGVAFGSALVTLPDGMLPISMQVTNTTYAALSMRDGDSFAKKFGGPSGDDPDWFLLQIIGLDAQDEPLGMVDFYLADFRFEDNAQDYIVSQWMSVDLGPLAAARKLTFALSSSDNHPDFGMNTPAYFAMDNLVLAPVPEPGTLGLGLLAGVLTMIVWRTRRAACPQR